MPPFQIPLDFPARVARGRDDFLVTQSNSDAVAWIDRWPDWPARSLVLVGPARSGKSHLAEVWRTASGAARTTLADLAAAGIEALTARAGTSLVIEDVDKELSVSDNENTLFHLYNLVQERGGSLLLTARSAPAAWDMDLADLRSRLGTIAVAHIREPDDALFQALVVKFFSDRQLAVAPEVVQYIVRRLERSFAAAERFVRRLDQSALAEKRNITVAFIRDLLKEEGE